MLTQRHQVHFFMSAAELIVCYICRWTIRRKITFDCINIVRKYKYTQQRAYLIAYQIKCIQIITYREFPQMLTIRGHINVIATPEMYRDGFKCLDFPFYWVKFGRQRKPKCKMIPK